VGNLANRWAERAAAPDKHVVAIGSIPFPSHRVAVAAGGIFSQVNDE